LSVRRNEEISNETVTLNVDQPGRIVEASEDGWILSLGTRNGVAIGDRFAALDDGAILEVIELLDAGATLCRAVDAGAALDVGTEVRPLPRADAP